MDFDTLKQQIGIGNLMAVGARGFVLTPSTVRFVVGPTRKHHVLVVELTPADTYTVTLLKISKDETSTVDETCDVYCDNIGEVVRRMGDRP